MFAPLVLAGLVAAVSLGATVPPPSGPLMEDCVDGWSSPGPNSVEYVEAIIMLNSQMGITGELDVVDMRYFTGPDVPEILEPHYEVVERWYVKVAAVDDPTFQGRFILEARTEEIRGIAAVAPFDTVGFQSPDWRAFEGEGDFREIEGLPGEWSGLEYDFVTGEDGPGFPGLPAEVVGCVAVIDVTPDVSTPPTSSRSAGIDLPHDRLDVGFLDGEVTHVGQPGNSHE